MRNFCLFLFLCFNLTAFAQYREMEVVRSYGRNLSLWCSTQDISYREGVLDQCSRACRVNDEIMIDFAQGGPVIRNYVVENYLNGFQSALLKGPVTFKVSNIRVISISEQMYSSSRSYEDAKRAKDYTTIACDLTIRGALNYDVTDLFYLKKNEIVNISKYEEVVDVRTGKKKVRVSFSDLEDDEETFGFSYNYGKHFPIGGSFNYSPESCFFMLSVDFGVNLDKDKYIIDKVKMLDILNFERERKILDPKMFLSVTPQVYFKYVSVGCGAGIFFLSGTKEKTVYSTGPNGSYTGSTSYSEAEMIKPMIRPVVKGFIPVADNLSLSISAGYDLVFGYKEKNGFNVGLGLQWSF